MQGFFQLKHNLASNNALELCHTFNTLIACEIVDIKLHDFLKFQEAKGNMKAGNDHAKVIL